MREQFLLLPFLPPPSLCAPAATHCFLVLMTCDEAVTNVKGCSGLMVLFCNDFSYLSFSIDLFTEGVGMHGNALVNVTSQLGYILVPF